MYNNILFDLDGTLIDSMEGITKCVRYSLAHYGIDEPDPDKLVRFIGPPLLDSFMRFYGFDREKAVEAVHKYRERYEPTGLYEYKLYDGIEEMLKRLKQSGKRIILATAKPTASAVRIIKNSGLDKYFDYMRGADPDGPVLYKHQVIEDILHSQNITDIEHTIMVGDKTDDVRGAKKHGIGCIGVRYGFGDDEELKECVAVADDVRALAEILLRD